MPRSPAVAMTQATTGFLVIVGVVGGVFFLTRPSEPTTLVQPVSSVGPLTPSAKTPSMTPLVTPSSTPPRATTARPTRAPSPTSSPSTPRPTASARSKALVNLTPTLADRIEDAMAAARVAGIELHVNSGWRSMSHQQRLWREAVKKYGSEKAARRWVLPPDKSAHPQGKAVDMGPPGGAAWLAKRSERYGLCLRYQNEPWHFEAVIARGGTCPALASGAEG